MISIQFYIQLNIYLTFVGKMSALKKTKSIKIRRFGSKIVLRMLVLHFLNKLND